VFFTDVFLAPAWVATPLHEAKAVTINDDARISAYGFVQMVFEQPSVAMGIVPMQVAD
jgi:hypothetical protein